MTTDTLSELVHEAAPHLRVSIVYTDNASTMISYRRQGREVRFRLHHMFQDAPDAVLEAIQKLYFSRLRKSEYTRLNRLVREYINSNQHRVRPCQRSHRNHCRLETRGRVYDLAELYRGVNMRYFGGKVNVDVTWSLRPNRISMGTWRGSSNGDPSLVTINRLLDDERVPPFYVEYILYHEMLHEVVGGELHNGRTMRHTRAYRELEREFERYEEAIAWGKENVAKLWRRARWRNGTRPR